MTVKKWITATSNYRKRKSEILKVAKETNRKKTNEIVNLNWLEKILLFICCLFVYLILTFTLTKITIKQVMKKYPEIYTEEALNKFGLTKKK